MRNLKEVTIGNSVTSIGGSAFEDCSGLTSVTIPNSVTSIGSDAFFIIGLTKVNYLGTVDKWVEIDFEEDDSNPTFYAKDLYINNELLTNVKITTADSIKNYVFYNCLSIKSVEIGENVTSISSSAFSGCSGLTSVIWNAKNCEDFEYDSHYREYTSPFYNIRSNITSFTFGNEVEHIPAYLCSGMSKLTEITIPNSVTSIGSSAFSSCSGLISVAIPNSVTSIGENAFSGCSGLTSVIWNAKNCEDFKYDSRYGTSTAPFYNIRSNITSFTFGNEVEHIPAYLCFGMSKLTKMTIPNSVTSIGRSAFSSCSGLTSVIWNAKNCEDFSSSTYSPFYDTSSSITSFTFGNEVEHIPAYLCYGMENLKEVTIGKSVTSIGDDAFYNCSGLTSVTIPNSVTFIGQYAFNKCSGLTKVNYLGTVDKWVEIDFKNSYSTPTYYAKDLYINNELLTNVKITTADSIKPFAFYNCENIKSVEIGNSVMSIGEDAFSGCSGLTSVSIPNSVTSIGQYAFKDCSELTSVSIGESVTSIGSDAFYGCDKLKKVTAYPTTVPNAYESSFAHYNAYLYVPCDVYEDYDLDDVFGSFKYIKCIAAQEVDAPDKVEIEVDEDNNANVIWPSTDGAKKYELEISKDGEVFCTLLFNENGQLTSIDFGNRSASVGFQFTVTGLDGASKYAYSMVAMDKKGNELQSYKGTFTTNGYVPGPGEEDEPTSITETLTDANITVSGGTISADADFSIYNTIGQDVTALNGSLQPGIYVVVLGEDRVKVMVK